MRVDTVKGIAVMAVVLIHAKLFVDSVFHEFVIDRAVPVPTLSDGPGSPLAYDNPWSGIFHGSILPPLFLWAVVAGVGIENAGLTRCERRPSSA